MRGRGWQLKNKATWVMGRRTNAQDKETFGLPSVVIDRNKATLKAQIQEETFHN